MKSLFVKAGYPTALPASWKQEFELFAQGKEPSWEPLQQNVVPLKDQIRIVRVTGGSSGALVECVSYPKS